MRYTRSMSQHICGLVATTSVSSVTWCRDQVSFVATVSARSDGAREPCALNATNRFTFGVFGAVCMRQISAVLPSVPCVLSPTAAGQGPNEAGATSTISEPKTRTECPEVLPMQLRALQFPLQAEYLRRGLNYGVKKALYSTSVTDVSPECN